MNIRQLQCFKAVVELKSFTRAADHLNISQPALGAQIRHLEAELKGPLFIRNARGVEATETGKLLYSHITDILQRLVQAKASVLKLTSATAEVVTIGLASSLALDLAPQLFELSASEMPGVRLIVIEDISSVLAQSVLDGKIDVACTYDTLTDDLEKIAICRDEILLIGTEETLISMPSTVRFDETSDIPILMPRLQNEALTDIIRKAAAQASVQLNVMLEAQSERIPLALVKDGRGCTYMPWSAVWKELEEGSLSSRRISHPPLMTDISLIFSQQSERPRARDVGKILERCLRAQIDERGFWRPAGTVKANALD